MSVQQEIASYTYAVQQLQAMPLPLFSLSTQEIIRHRLKVRIVQLLKAQHRLRVSTQPLVL